MLAIVWNSACDRISNLGLSSFTRLQQEYGRKGGSSGIGTLIVERACSVHFLQPKTGHGIYVIGHSPCDNDDLHTDFAVCHRAISWL